MNKVTLYWDDNSFGLFYYNGKRWRYRALSGWRNCINQNWQPGDFDRSLVVNNFKEKLTLSILETVKRGYENDR